MATLATQNVNRAGVLPTYSAVSAADRFTPGLGTFLHVKNAGASSDTVTVAATKVPLPNMTIANVVVAVPNGSERMIGPFPPEFFTATDGSGLCDVTHSFTTSVTVAVVNLVQP
jgi:hypothetical protein